MVDENPYQPVVGDWYQDEQGRVFEIVAVDDDEGTVGIQLYEGDVGQYDMDTWQTLVLSPAAPPEDWSAPFDEMARDDLGYSDSAIHPEDWSGPLNDVDRMD